MIGITMRLNGGRRCGIVAVQGGLRFRRPGFRRSRLGRDAGFSLVEVMVAMLVLGIALVGLTRGITTALGSSKESELQTTAALFAAGQIEALRAQEILVDETSEGQCAGGLALYRWKQTVSPTDIDGLHDVEVVIESSGSGKTIYALRTLLFEPPEDSNAKPVQPKSGKGGSRTR